MYLSSKKAQSGFTLVELLIVVIILAILAAIVVPQFASSTDDAKVSSLDTTLANMRSAIDLYYQQHGEYPGANSAEDIGGKCGGTVSGTAASAGTQAGFVDQLAMYTDKDGAACSAKGGAYEFGPYIKKREMPENPITLDSNLAVVSVGDLNMAAAVKGGWKYDTLTGKFIANDTTNGYNTH